MPKKRPLAWLDLGGNGITPDGMKHIGAALASAVADNAGEGLEHLDLCGNPIGDKGVEHLVDFLARSRTLTTLNLRGPDKAPGAYADDSAWIGHAGAQHIAGALESNGLLKRGENYKNAQWPKELFERLAPDKQHVAVRLPGLTRLGLGRNLVGDAGARSLARMLQFNASLTYLALDDNGIGRSGAEALAAALNDSRAHNGGFLALAVLNLRDNPIGGRAAAAIVGTGVAAIAIQRCNVKNDGANEIAKVLETNTTTSSLGLGFHGNGITDAFLLAVAIKNNKTLTSIDLGNYRKAGRRIGQKILTKVKRNKDNKRKAREYMEVDNLKEKRYEEKQALVDNAKSIKKRLQTSGRNWAQRTIARFSPRKKEGRKAATREQTSATKALQKSIKAAGRRMSTFMSKFGHGAQGGDPKAQAAVSPKPEIDVTQALLQKFAKHSGSGALHKGLVTNTTERELQPKNVTPVGSDVLDFEYSVPVSLRETPIRPPGPRSARRSLVVAPPAAPPPPMSPPGAVNQEAAGGGGDAIEFDEDVNWQQMLDDDDTTTSEKAKQD